MLYSGEHMLTVTVTFFLPEAESSGAIFLFTKPPIFSSVTSFQQTLKVALPSSPVRIVTCSVWQSKVSSISIPFIALSLQPFTSIVIVQLAHQLGYRVLHKTPGVWHWEKLWKQAGFPRPR